MPSGRLFEAFEADGSARWLSPMVGDDGTGRVTGMLGCATFDLDADGADEVVVGDGAGLRVLSGRDGRPRWGSTEHGAYPKGQVPVVADVDGDGRAEIVVGSTDHLLNPSDWTGVQVYGHTGAGWAPSGSSWGTSDFAGDASALSPTWLSPGRFRGRAVALPGEIGPDLAVEVVDRCGCDDGELRLSVVVANEGGAPGDALVRVVAVWPEGERVLEELALGEVGPATSAAAVEVVLAADEVADARVELRLVGEDCDPTDEVVVLHAPCVGRAFRGARGTRLPSR